jgi:hypothetical protein
MSNDKPRPIQPDEIKKRMVESVKPVDQRSTTVQRLDPGPTKPPERSDDKPPGG